MSEESDFKRRALNVLAVVLNLATLFFALVALGGVVHVILNKGGWDHAIYQFFISAIGFAVILAVSYMALGNAGVWNRLKRANSSGAA